VLLDAIQCDGVQDVKVIAGRGRRTRSVPAAAALEPLFRAVLGSPLPLRIELWDGSGIGPHDGPGTASFGSVEGIRRVLWAPDELGLARAFVAGDVEIDGDLFGVLRALETAPLIDRRIGPRAVAAALAGARRLGGLGRPPPPPPEEAQPGRLRHSKRRDESAISHHYDVGNDFYRLVLGPSMTYSCARFADDSMSLEEAQAAKHDLVCAKLGLADRPGLHLLDVGCGWGSMAIHAASHYGATVVGATISQAQAELARQRVADRGLSDRIEIVLRDYRDLGGEHFDAISSIGMFEHVGLRNAGRYFATLRSLLRPQGRMLNHAISAPGGYRPGRRTFTHRYVFPNGELPDLGEVVLAMGRADFEVRDVESLREHYPPTLRQWVANLEADWDQAVAEAGIARARIWRLYMAGSAVSFDMGELSVHQVLGVVPDDRGHSAIPRTRAGWS